jgi:hypothetical protein
MTDRWTKLMTNLDEIQHTLRGSDLTPAIVGSLVQQAEELYGRASRELMRTDLYSSVRRVSQTVMDRESPRPEPPDSAFETTRT